MTLLGGEAQPNQAQKKKEERPERPPRGRLGSKLRKIKDSLVKGDAEHRNKRHVDLHRRGKVSARFRR